MPTRNVKEPAEVTKPKTVKKEASAATKTSKTTGTSSAKSKKTTKNAGVPISGGDKRCYVYFDAKFINRDINSDFLSFSLVDYTGNTFYVEFSDFDATKIDKEHNMKYIDGLMAPETNIIREHFYLMRSTKENIKFEVLKWIGDVSKDCSAIQLVCDNNAYGFVRFLDFISDNGNLPDIISPVYYDINQDIATSISRPNRSKKSDEEFNMNYIPVLVASEINRFDFVKSFRPTFEYNKSKDTSVFTALTTMIIHQYLWGFQ